MASRASSIAPESSNPSNISRIPSEHDEGALEEDSRNLDLDLDLDPLSSALEEDSRAR